MKRVTSQLQQTYLAQSILLDRATWGRRPLRECVLDTITLPPALTMLLRTVRLVDLDAVRFLAAAERRGVELRNLPRYVREWIFIETPRLGDLE